MCNYMLSIIVNNYSKSELENKVFAIIPGLKSEVFPLTHIKSTLLLGESAKRVSCALVRTERCIPQLQHLSQGWLPFYPHLE